MSDAVRYIYFYSEQKADMSAVNQFSPEVYYSIPGSFAGFLALKGSVSQIAATYVN